MENVIFYKGLQITKRIKSSNLRAFYRRSRRMCSIEEGVLKNFRKLTGKHLRQSLPFNKVTC